MHFDTARDLAQELERFYEHYLAKDLDHFRISEDHAAGFHAFVAELKKNGLPPAARFLKGHCTGPLTFGITVKDSDGKDIVYHDILFDAITKGLAMKAAWQVRILKQFGLPVILFIDDPAMYALSSGLYSLSPDLVAVKLREIITAVHDEGGIAGIHCCGNADWPLLFRTGADIISFDAVSYLDKVLLYRSELKDFFHLGGSLAWGIVPTTGFTGSETADGLVEQPGRRNEARLSDAGIDRATILRQMPYHAFLRTGKPDDGTGGSDPEADEGSVGQDAGKNDLKCKPTGAGRTKHGENQTYLIACSPLHHADVLGPFPLRSVPLIISHMRSDHTPSFRCNFPFPNI